MNYAPVAARVIRAIAVKGKPLTLQRPGTAAGWTRSYDAAQMRDKWTNDTTLAVVYVDPASTPDNRITRGVEYDYAASEIDGTMVKIGDRRYLIGADIPEPTNIDRIVDGSASLAVVRCKRVAPGPVVVLYEVQCRG